MTHFANIAAGLVLAASLSQFPEFSQHYVQRLGSAVDELSAVTEDGDQSAGMTGYAREMARASVTGTEFLHRQQSDMHRTVGRHEQLLLDHDYLREANVYQRLAYILWRSDNVIARQAWADFRPSVPMTLEGLALALIGYLSGYGALSILSGLRRGRINGRLV